MSDESEFDTSTPPSGTGCVECLESGGWWFHLRRCARCGHIGCCDSSPSQHASRHAAATGHWVARSFEPGEYWFWDFRARDEVQGPELAPLAHRPLDQPAPGPKGKVPRDWEQQLH